MKLRTEITLKPFPFQLEHASCSVLMGSCFSENIAQKLHFFRFPNLSNPMGISYNPHSIHKNLRRVSPFTASEFHCSKGLYFHDELHSDFSGLQLDELVEKSSEALEKQKKYLSQCKTLFLSYGTAWVYEKKANQSIVNNCHKQAANLFQKRLMKAEEIVESWKKTQKELELNYPQIEQVVFTVSPIRHIKDGMAENQLSKSTLRVALAEICSTSANLHYFPSYEILVDDLRDYRFYEADLIHPNQVAIDYIWEKFSAAFFSEETQSVNAKVKQLNQSIAHRPFHEKSEAHQQFLARLIQELRLFQEKYKIDFNADLQSLKERLISD